MALKPCKACGHEVSKTAESCPNCGERLKAKPAGCGSIIIVLLVVLFIYSAIDNDKKPSNYNSSSSSRQPSGHITNGASPSSENAIVEFTEDDFYWDDVTTPHQATIIAGVNKVHKENSRCKTIDPSSAYVSSSKGTPDNPVFFVMCGKGAQVFNAYFSKSDVEADSNLTAVKHIDKNLAVDKCERYAKSQAMNPSTVEFSRIIDMNISEHGNGRTTVLSSFSAKNKLGLELKYNIRCLMDAKGLFEATIIESID